MLLKGIPFYLAGFHGNQQETTLERISFQKHRECRSLPPTSWAILRPGPTGQATAKPSLGYKRLGQYMKSNSTFSVLEKDS